MKVLLIHQYFLELNDGGGSRFNEMADLWTKEGNQVTVLAGMMHANGSEKPQEYKGKYFVKKEHGEVEVIRCHVSESYNSGFVGRLWGYFSFVFSSIYAGLFKTKSDYDVILVTSPPLFVGITAYILSIVKRIPFVFEVRDLWPESAIDTGVVKNKTIIKFAYWFESFIYRKAALINVLTPAFREKLINEKKVIKDKVIFIPNAADFTLSEKIQSKEFGREKFREEEGWNGKKVITYVGAHGVANHLIQVVEIAERIKEKMPDFLFVLIGGGMQKEMLKQEAEKRSCNNIKFYDPVPKQEVFKYILASDFGASILKRVDTFKTIYSNKTFDYMSCKKPILLAIDGVSRDLIEKADCGFYIEPEDVDSWEEVLTLIDKIPSEELTQKGINGYNYAKAHFDRIELGRKYIELIKNEVFK